jgi:hypothetical protein
MALAVVTCISSWRGHMKQSSKDELEALQEVARKGIVYVRNWDQSDISRAIFNPEVPEPHPATQPPFESRGFSALTRDKTQVGIRQQSMVT